jgi:hypothetical protein
MLPRHHLVFSFFKYFFLLFFALTNILFSPPSPELAPLLQRLDALSDAPGCGDPDDVPGLLSAVAWPESLGGGVAFLTDDGRVAVWRGAGPVESLEHATSGGVTWRDGGGENAAGENAAGDASATVPPEITSLGAGKTHAVAVDADGRVWVAGAACVRGELGLGRGVTATGRGGGGGGGGGVEFVRVMSLEKRPPVQAVVCGAHHTLVITTCGQALAFGNNAAGQVEWRVAFYIIIIFFFSR